MSAREKLTVGYIPSATVEPVITVRESDTLDRAVTLMRIHNFSQLPVMRGKARRPLGVISWRSIGRALLLDSGATLSDCVETMVARVQITDDLIETIDRVNADDYVLVIKSNGDLSGIVTSADLGAALADIARPYLLILQCEEALRDLVRLCLERAIVSPEDITEAMQSKERTFKGEIADLPFGDLVKVAAHPPIWSASSHRTDRSVLLDELGEVARLRNEVMHFREHSPASVRVQARLNGVIAEVLSLTAGLDK